MSKSKVNLTVPDKHAFKFKADDRQKRCLKNCNSKDKCVGRAELRNSSLANVKQRKSRLELCSKNQNQEFVTTDINAYRLSEDEQMKRIQERKSKNQIFGQLEVYNRQRPVHERIPKTLTSKLFKETIQSKENLFSFEVAMQRSEEVLKLSKTLLQEIPSYKSSPMVFTSTSTEPNLTIPDYATPYTVFSKFSTRSSYS